MLELVDKNSKTIRFLCEKIIKWTRNFIRIILFKIYYGKNFSVKIFCRKPVYIGKRCLVKISSGGGKIILHSGVYLEDYCTLDVTDGGIIEIQKDCYFNTYCRVVAKQRINIGENSIFGSNVSLYDHDHDITDGVKHSINRYKIASVSIGSFVWCGTNVVITSGVKIEENCVIGANTVVTGSLTGNGVYTGCPAKLKRNLITD